jgi:hypothetical protein
MTAGRVLEVEIGQGDNPQDLVNSLLTNCATACYTFSVELLGGGLLAANMRQLVGGPILAFEIRAGEFAAVCQRGRQE